MNNTVETESSATSGDNDVFVTNANIGIGTYTSATAANTSEASTWGVSGAVASASAETDVTSNQTVALAPDTNLTATGDINLIAGDNPTNGADSPGTMVGNADAQSYARAFVAIPAATATAKLTSNVTLTVAATDQIESGENTSLAADAGNPSAAATGIGHGYELGFIPVTDGHSSKSTPTSSTLTLNGTVTAGIYHELSITIPDDGSSPISGTPYSSTVDVNGTQTTVASAPSESLLNNSTFMAFTASFDPSFNPFTTIQNAANAGAFPDSGEAAALEDAVYHGDVGAIVLGSLFAAGGDVTVNAGTLAGNGSITAYGGPTITITNDSPDYLVLDSIDIPDEPGGQVIYSGKAIAAPFAITQSGSGAPPDREHPGDIPRRGSQCEYEQPRTLCVPDRRDGRPGECHARDQWLRGQRSRPGFSHRRRRVVDPGGQHQRHSGERQYSEWNRGV